MDGLGLMIGKLCVGICLAGDVTATSAVVCPPLREWTPSFQKQISSELRAAPKRDALGRVVADAITDRDMARACREK